MRLSKRPYVVLASLTCAGLQACQPDLSVGTWSCAQAGAASDESTPVGSPWNTGFEDEFCSYSQLGGFCYAGDGASYTTVTSPVHSGRNAAAFTVVGGDTPAHQTRCVRQGVLPAAAYYGAWYFIPATATNRANWNLVHFRGGTPAEQHGLWDISLVNGTDGQLEAMVFDFLNGVMRRATKPTPVPIATWFHLELYLKRAPDATGEVALYQDDQLLFEAKNLITDDTNWGQWYVGNLATRLTPRDSTLYIDDVTIRSSR